MVPFSLDVTKFKPVYGEAADEREVLDTHPDEELVAMRVPAGADERAAVWSRRTGRVVWKPANTAAVCWRSGGAEVLMLREERSDTGMRRIAPAPRRAEYAYYFDRRTWPRKKTIVSGRIKPPAGRLTRVAASPAEMLAVFSWREGAASGFEFVEFSDEWIYQIDGAGYRERTGLLAGPVFSPDGHFVVATAGRPAWWTADGDPESASAGGTLETGCVIVADVATKDPHETHVTVVVPKGWRPDDLDAGERLSLPRFVDARRFVVALPNGEERTFETG